ncbi:MAG: hypothetical protein DLM61_19795 [Pseudonocardiales bacterium]|nr:MAG: hypothetical protein DLM61_19795 [Pseudonocardiales bacterium]
MTIVVSGPVDRVWHLAAHQRQWRFVSQPTRRVVAVLDLSTEQAWRLLTNNLPAEARQDLRVSGDESVVQALLQARAIIGVPK